MPQSSQPYNRLAVNVENVSYPKAQRPSAVVWFVPITREAIRWPQAKYFADPETFVQQQKPSLVVVIGGGPTYSDATQGLHGRYSKVFGGQDVQVYQKSWLVAPFGPAQYPTNPELWPQAKYFADVEIFHKEYRPSPRSTTDFYGTADIFKGFDTYGWPPDDKNSETFVSAAPYTRVVLDGFPVYQFATDIIFRRPQAKYFVDPEVYFTGAKPLYNASINFGANVTRGLTGLTITSVPGSLGLLINLQPLTGISLTFAQGTINSSTSGNLSLGLGSLSLTFTTGTLTPVQSMVFYPTWSADGWADGWPGGIISADGWPGWSADGYLPPVISGGINLPNLVGLTWYQAVDVLWNLGLFTVVPMYTNLQGVAPGIVMGQSPPAGTFVSPDSLIGLTVAGNPYLLAVTNDPTV